MTKPKKPGKPVEKTEPEVKKTQVRRSLKLTDDQLATCKKIAEKHTVFGVEVPPLNVAAEALKRGLEAMTNK
jgi:hypothetical protein